MSNSNWILVNRKIRDNWIWNSPEQLRAWLDLIMLANYEDKKSPYKGKIITCKRGDVNLSISYLAKRWGWGRNRTRAFLELLEQDNMIKVNATTNRTTITLVNYGVYQHKGATNRATNKATNKATNRATSDTQRNKYKTNEKEIKEEAPPISPSETKEIVWKGKTLDELSDDEYWEYMMSEKEENEDV